MRHVSIVVVGFFVGAQVAGAETMDCPAELPSGTLKKEMKCLKDNEVADVKTVPAPEGSYKDYYLYCGNRLQASLLPIGFHEPVCWKIAGAVVTMWYRSFVPSPEK